MNEQDGGAVTTAPDKTAGPHGRDLPTAALLPFVVITFVITWGTASLYIGFPDSAVSWFGEISGSHPLFFLATWGPTIAAWVLVPLCAGWAGLTAFVSRLRVWRCAPMWAAFVLVGLPLVFMAGSLIKGGGFLAPLPGHGPAPMVAAMFMMLFLGPIEGLQRLLPQGSARAGREGRHGPRPRWCARVNLVLPHHLPQMPAGLRQEPRAGCRAAAFDRPIAKTTGSDPMNWCRGAVFPAVGARCGATGRMVMWRRPHRLAKLRRGNGASCTAR